MRDREGVDIGGHGSGEELGGVEGEERVIQLYYVRKIFSVNGKNKVKH